MPSIFPWDSIHHRETLHVKWYDNITYPLTPVQQKHFEKNLSFNSIHTTWLAEIDVAIGTTISDS